MNDPVGSVLEARGVRKSFHQGPREVKVLKDVNLVLAAGESLAIVGASGAGKSTLLHILGGLDQPDAGEVLVEQASLWGLNASDRSRVRNSVMGFVYQFHHLLPEFTALENVAMPLLIRGDSVSAARTRAAELLDRVGLAERLTHKPGELSGGERQRAAVARALVGNPRVVLGDEPTGNLDERTADHVYGLLLELNQELNTSLLLVTHDTRLAARMDRQMELRMGCLQELG
ncbi:MAG: lipoprotein-releasing ABC transporter ATP-binding protein LolD [Xanthomonadales bacterium]|nr:lipoprotein-releasing ABC transporter ATP-binding protein LolD [Gammaproteobacteria bacterium]MBT8052790.1 lipoprotein-releasing ABC transporter ATP-binding protein LolD [Gammaproteobacteria bacterium]NND56147.1 lipoprotein-releasing ABC transporter ATP-binding protein LolD [Xanthomonadales bacterium]NNK50552.1 lipoprotein-releasing ABC transporter ATP-binding protein LolD [Xanthomonadales bacterium]